MRQLGLVYGDRVLLSEEREGGAFLQSDGNVDKATYLQPRNRGSARQATIVDCVFEVSHRRTYRAHRALDEARESDLAFEEKQRRMQKLRARVAEETEANEKETELIAGEPIVYGSTIQLRCAAGAAGAAANQGHSKGGGTQGTQVGTFVTGT
jgi:hypothetical protein